MYMYCSVAVTIKFHISESDSPEVKLPSPSQKRTRRSLTSPLLSPLSTSLSPSLLFHPSQSVWDVNSLPRYALSLSLSLSLALPLVHSLYVNYLNYSIVSDLILCEPRRSVTELEVDIMVADILNRHELSLSRPIQSIPLL